MIERSFGNIFDTQANVLVNPVDTIGISRGGLAKKFAIRYPEVEAAYREFSKRGGWAVGTPVSIGGSELAVNLHLCRAKDGRLIVNLPTIHENARLKSTYGGIRTNLID